MARKRTGRAHPDAPYELVDDEPAPRRRSSGGREEDAKGRSWITRLFRAVVVLAVLACLLPTIVTHTPLKDVALDWAGKQVGLQLEAEQLRGGWVTPASAVNLVIRDLQGQPLIEAEEATLSKTLIELIQDRSKLGLLKLTRPSAQIVLHEHGNNWQDALAPLLKSSGSSRPAIELEVVEGHAHLQDNRHLRSWDASPLQLHAVLDSASLEAPLSAELATSLTDDKGKTGEVEFTMRSADLSLSNVQAGVDSHGMPLAMLQPLLSAVDSRIQISGDADIRSRVKVVTDPSLRVHVTLQSMDIREFVATSEALPAGDTVRFKQLTGAGDLRWQNGHVLAEDLQLQSDVASLTANGRVKLAHLASRRLDKEDRINIAARVDVARLAAMMPTTMRIKHDTRIESGTVIATLDSRTEEGLRVWHGVVNTSGIAATTAGRQVAWDEPVSIEVDATQHEGRWSMRKLDCRSSFLTVAGSGDADRGRLDVSGNLDRLRDELSQLVELGDIRMAGVTEGELQWQRSPAGVRGSGALTLSDFQLALPGKASLEEKQLELKFSGQGQVDGQSGLLASIEQAEASIAAAGDALQAVLLRPTQVRPGAAYPVRTQIRGDLGRWVMRLAVLTDQPRLRADGVLDFDAEMDLGARHIKVGKSQLSATPCKIIGLGLPIDEPQLKAEIIGSYDMRARRWTGGDSNLVSATFAARCKNLVVEPSTITGDIACRGNLQRMLRLCGVEARHSTCRGEFTGALRLVQSGGATEFVLEQRLSDFQLLRRDTTGLRTVGAAPAWSVAWAEPYIDVEAAGLLEPRQEQVRFDKLNVRVDSAQLSVAGNVTELPRRFRADLQGKLSYDLSRLTNKLRPLTGEAVVLTGVSDQPISIRGPLLPSSDPSHVAAGARPLLPMELTAQAGFAWDGATIQGFRVGPGQVSSSLEQATIRFDGVDIPVSQGKIMLAPEIDLQSASPVLTVPPGPVIERLSISPEMTATWLKYVAPALADATRIDGSFSATAEEVRVPLAQPETGRFKGTLVIHEAKAGPGPLAQQLLQVVEQSRNLIKGVKQGAGGVDLNRAVQLLNNGKLLNAEGKLDPRRTFGALLGNPPAASGSPTDSDVVWLSVPEHTIPCHVANGRVHHENMRVLIDDVEIRTTGSVGFDESLNLVAELAIPDQWIGDDARLASLKGQVFKLPVGGTIRQPRLDREVFRQLTRQLLNTATTGVVNNALGGGLFGQGPASQGGVPNMTPTPEGLSPPPDAGAPPAPANSGAVADPLQQKVDEAAEKTQQEVDRALNKLFGR